MLKPITEEFFKTEEEFNLESVYREVFGMEEEQMQHLKQDVLDKFKTADKTFADAPEQERAFLKKFSFICLLSFDVYVKKLLIEKLVDDLRDGEAEKK